MDRNKIVIGKSTRLCDEITSARLTVAFMAEQTYRVPDENGDGQYMRLCRELIPGPTREEAQRAFDMMRANSAFTREGMATDLMREGIVTLSKSWDAVAAFWYYEFGYEI